MIVLDANAALTACAATRGLERLGDEDLVAPPLLWPEARSVLHVAWSRGLLSRDEAERTLAAVTSGRIAERRPSKLGTETWRIADELGWSKTYDAEYLALATLLKAPVVTLDQRVVRAAVRLGLPTRSLPVGRG